MFTVEVLQNDAGMWFWHIKGGNGEIVASSETMFNREDVLAIGGMPAILKYLYKIGFIKYLVLVKK